MTEYAAVRDPENEMPATPYLSCRFLADAALLLVTAIWGGTFVMVKDAVAAYPVFSFLALRFAFAAMALIPLVWLRKTARPEIRIFAHVAAGAAADEKAPLTPSPGGDLRQSWGEPGPPKACPERSRRVGGRGALFMGAALFAGYGFQTAGLHLTTPAKAGFITGLSVVIVPLVSAFLLRRPPARKAWFGVGSATLGLALLSLQADLSVAAGDLLVFGCAVAFAAHILLTGRFAFRFDPLLLTLGQIVVVGLLCAAAALVLEVPGAGLAALAEGLSGRVLFAAVFTGVLATSAAFGIQTVAQRFTSATHTALIFAAEPVFAALFSFLLIGETLGPRQLLGCGLILAGMMASR